MVEEPAKLVLELMPLPEAFMEELAEPIEYQKITLILGKNDKYYI